MSSFTIPTVFTAVDKLTGPLGRMGAGLKGFTNAAVAGSARMQRGMRKASEFANTAAKNMAVGGAILLSGLAAATNEAIKFEDKQADIAKTTGLSGDALTKFGDDILKMGTTTRTAVDDLQTIAEIGGQLGVAQKELLAFTQSANKFNVALGKDFSGGVEEAVSQIGKVKALFSQSRGLDISTVLNNTGSAINELGAVGAGTSANITDFTLRIGALPDALKPSLTDTLALGTALEEMGIDAQIGAGGLTNLLLVAGERIGGFAKQMKMSAGEAKALLATNPTEFVKKFAASFEGMAPEKLAKTLKKLGVGSQESIKVLGALASNTARVTELQKLSNKSFDEGTSLNAEYTKKNETMAAKLAIAKNNMQQFSIIIGTQLMPVLGELLKQVIPLIQSFGNWIKQNPGFIKGLVQIIKWGAILTGVFKVFSIVMTVVNAVMYANPIGLIVLGIIALIALVTAIIIKWNEWGAAVSLFLGPIGLLIIAIMTIRTHWNNIVKSFSDGGILSGLKAIGAMLFDLVLYPLQQILSAIGKIPGMGFAKDAAMDIKEFRESLNPDVKPVANTQAARDENGAGNYGMGTVDINVNDPNKRTNASTTSPYINVKSSSTMGWNPTGG